MWKDFCPLCASVFQADTAEEIVGMIEEHIDSGWCKEHFLPLKLSLWINSYEKAEWVAEKLDKGTLSVV